MEKTNDAEKNLQKELMEKIEKLESENHSYEVELEFLKEQRDIQSKEAILRAQKITHLDRRGTISHETWICLNSLFVPTRGKDGMAKVKELLYDFLLEYNEHSPSDEKQIGNLVIITLLQLCDSLAVDESFEMGKTDWKGLEGGAINQPLQAKRFDETEEEIKELFEWDTAKGYAEDLNHAIYHIRESVGKDGGASEKGAQSVEFSLTKIKDFLFQLEILKLEKEVASKESDSDKMMCAA